MSEIQNIRREFKFPKKYSFAEFLEFVEGNEERYELIDGRIYMMASPNVGHQDIVLFVGSALKNYLKGKKCRVFISPLDVVLFDKNKEDKEDKDNSQNVFQPDVFVVCNADKIAKDKIYGAPDFVVEVVSPSSEAHDYIRKLEIYKKYGVKEYWIINPETKEIFVYINCFKEVTEYSFEDKIKVGIFEDFEDFYIDFKEF